MGGQDLPLRFPSTDVVNDWSTNHQLVSVCLLANHDFITSSGKSIFIRVDWLTTGDQSIGRSWSETSVLAARVQQRNVVFSPQTTSAPLFMCPLLPSHPLFVVTFLFLFLGAFFGTRILASSVRLGSFLLYNILQRTVQTDCVLTFSFCV